MCPAFESTLFSWDFVVFGYDALMMWTVMPYVIWMHSLTSKYLKPLEITGSRPPQAFFQWTHHLGVRKRRKRCRPSQVTNGFTSDESGGETDHLEKSHFNDLQWFPMVSHWNEDVLSDVFHWMNQLFRIVLGCFPMAIHTAFGNKQSWDEVSVLQGRKKFCARSPGSWANLQFSNATPHWQDPGLGRAWGTHWRSSSFKSSC